MLRRGRLGSMKFTVQKAFTALGQTLARGDVVELPFSHRVQNLIDSRFLLPADPEVAQATTNPQNELTNAVVTRRSKKD